eukprot:SAG22_NODE_1906_length_3335_cov_1.833127_2_plen_90_part_00
MPGTTEAARYGNQSAAIAAGAPVGTPWRSSPVHFAEHGVINPLDLPVMPHSAPAARYLGKHPELNVKDFGLAGVIRGMPTGMQQLLNRY